MSEQIGFTQGKKQREELQLPILHFIAADDWMDKLGNDAFCAWLKFYSWCDRSEQRMDKENDVVPMSFNIIMKRLGVGRQKFYQKIIPVLWDYGLIDLVEYEKSKSDGQKPMNIIVYDRPQNKHENAVKSLVKVRDYATEYVSTARTFAKKRGRRPKQTRNQNIYLDGSKIKRGVVLKSNGGGSKIKPNNGSNLFNDSNSESNGSNKIHPSMEKIETKIRDLDVPPMIKNTLFSKMDRLMDDHINLSDLENNYKANVDILSLAEYENALQFALDSPKKIGSIRAVMRRNVEKQIEFRKKANESKSDEPPHRKEKLPKWMDEEHEQNLSEEEWEAKKHKAAEEKEKFERNKDHYKSEDGRTEEEIRKDVAERKKEIDRMLKENRKAHGSN